LVDVSVKAANFVHVAGRDLKNGHRNGLSIEVNGLQSVLSINEIALPIDDGKSDGIMWHKGATLHLSREKKDMVLSHVPLIAKLLPEPLLSKLWRDELGPWCKVGLH
jgi:hypothetical protein